MLVVWHTAGPINYFCRASLSSILYYLQGLSADRAPLLSTSELTKALQPSSSSSVPAHTSISATMPAEHLAVLAPQLLALLAKSSVLLVMALLTELLVADQSTCQTILTHPGTLRGQQCSQVPLISFACKHFSSIRMCERCQWRRQWRASDAVQLAATTNPFYMSWLHAFACVVLQTCTRQQLALPCALTGSCRSSAVRSCSRCLSRCCKHRCVQGRPSACSKPSWLQHMRTLSLTSHICHHFQAQFPFSLPVSTLIPKPFVFSHLDHLPATDLASPASPNPVAQLHAATAEPQDQACGTAAGREAAGNRCRV